MIMMECIIKRGSSYSTILLSDALKKLITPSFSVILLRVVSLFLKGLCAPLGIRSGFNETGNDVNNLVNIFTSASTYTGGVHNPYGDEHIQRAITWAEAILDSHFSALTFRASFHAPTRQALGCVMDAGAFDHLFHALTAVRNHCDALHFYLSVNFLSSIYSYPTCQLSPVRIAPKANSCSLSLYNFYPSIQLPLLMRHHKKLREH